MSARLLDLSDLSDRPLFQTLTYITSLKHPLASRYNGISWCRLVAVSRDILTNWQSDIFFKDFEFRFTCIQAARQEALVAVQLNRAQCQNTVGPLALQFPCRKVYRNRWLRAPDSHAEAGSVWLVPNASSAGIQNRRDSPGAMSCSPTKSWMQFGKSPSAKPFIPSFHSLSITCDGPRVVQKKPRLLSILASQSLLSPAASHFGCYQSLAKNLHSQLTVPHPNTLQQNLQGQVHFSSWCPSCIINQHLRQPWGQCGGAGVQWDTL